MTILLIETQRSVDRQAAYQKFQEKQENPGGAVEHLKNNESSNL